MQVLTQAIQWILQLLYVYTGNYGWAILLLTAGLRAALLPVQIWQMRGSKAMAALQEEAKRVQAKHKGEEAQRRLQALYASSGGALFTGCLPTLLQWPVFMAMYSALSHFTFAVPAAFLWLTSLAVPDPYFVLPILAVASSLVQTWLSVPKEQRLISALIPVLFGFLVLHASAAVALYWVASNLLSLGQQLLLSRRPATA